MSLSITSASSSAPVGNGIEAGVGVRNADKLGLRAVDRVAEDPAAGRAVRIHLLAAIVAFAAGVMQEIRTWSPGLNAVTAGADLVDDADALVAQNAARRAGRHVAFEDVQIGAADRRLGDLDDRVGGRGDLRLRALFQRLLPGP